MSKLGQFVWRENMTSDVAKAATFYKGLFGWKLEEVPMGEHTYTLIYAGERQIGGIMKAPPQAGNVPPHWASYVSVDDVDKTAVAAVEAGGKVVVPAQDIPDIGRFAVLLDPTGAAFTAWKSKSADTTPSAMPKRGEFCWEQLSTSDVAKAKAFYEKVLGWTSKSFGDGGDVVTLSAGEAMVASAMPAPPGVPPHWMTFVFVGKLADANQKVGELGGKVLMPEIPVPGMGAFSVVQDPNGATIGLFEERSGG